MRTAETGLVPLGSGGVRPLSAGSASAADDAPVVLEVEAKYQVADLEAVAEALAAQGVVLSEPVAQDDQAYAPQWWDYGQPKTGVPFARLRTENDRHVFTVKRPVENEMACEEHESPVDDRAQMHRAVVAMGFVPTVRIVKTRRTGRLGDLAVCLDDVEHAGAFLEVEKLVSSEESGEAVQRELDAIVRGLGVPAERTTDTYDSLIRAAVSSMSHHGQLGDREPGE